MKTKESSSISSETRAYAAEEDAVICDSVIPSF